MVRWFYVFDDPSKFTIPLSGFSIIVADRLFPLPFLQWVADVFNLFFLLDRQTFWYQIVILISFWCRTEKTSSCVSESRSPLCLFYDFRFNDG